MNTPLLTRPPAREEWQSHGRAPARAGQRLSWVDMLRGIALAGMVAYHGTWDLHAFAVTETDPGQDPGWRLLGRGVATLFLMLSGFGLSLAARQGASVRVTVMRLGRVTVAAAMISLVSWLAVPEAPIWFGILHCILVTNVLALALTPLPSVALLAIAAAAIAAPIALHGVVGLGWAWIGLAAREPVTLDFRPVLPWLAPVLLGVVLGRTPIVTAPDPAWLPSRMIRPFAWIGRHSLIIYMGHQPILIALLALMVGTFPQRGRNSETLLNPKQAAGFLQQCQSACSTNGGEAALCRSTCHCVLTNAVREAASTRPPLPFNSSSNDLAAAVTLCQRALSEDRP